MWILVLIAAWMIITWMIKLADLLAEKQKRREEAAREARPCSHGTVGAMLHPEKCPACLRVKAELEAQQRRDNLARSIRFAEQRKVRCEEWKAQVRVPEYLRKMHPQKFEELVAFAYEHLGYKVELTQYSGDGGVDAFLEKDGKRIILQCKRVQNHVGEPILRDLYGTMHHNNAHGGIVVTTGRVSDKAREWVRDKSIEIVELERLQEILEDVRPEEDFVPDSFSVQTKPAHLCSVCGGNLILRKGSRGKFWGCSGYPDCRFTKNYR